MWLKSVKVPFVLVVLGISLTALFQNCGGTPKVSVEHSLSTIGSTNQTYTIQNEALIVTGLTSTTLKLASLGADLPDVDMNILLNGVGASPSLAPVNLSPAVTLQPGSLECSSASAGTFIPDLAADGGNFLFSSQHEVFVLFTRSNWNLPSIPGSQLTGLNFEVYIRKAGVSQATFKQAICRILNSLPSPTVGIGTTSP